MALTSTISCPLFVPGNRPERFEKAAQSGADAIILDLEDAVATDAKPDARAALRTDFTTLPVIVRLNAIGTAWHDADLARAFDLSVAAIMLPKAEMSEAFIALAEVAVRHSVALVPLIETARGLAYARAISATAGVRQLAFGSIDFAADIGAAHVREALLTARSELVLASRLGRISAPIDGVTTAIDDSSLIAEDARYARDLGFGGKLAIHPRQIDAIRRGLHPTATEIDWAQRVLATGDGATALDGAMVDEPVRIRARAILSRLS